MFLCSRKNKGCYWVGRMRSDSFQSGDYGLGGKMWKTKRISLYINYTEQANEEMEESGGYSPFRGSRGYFLLLASLERPIASIALQIKIDACNY